MPVRAELLDDPERLAAADTGGALWAAAMAGAQVRATAEAAAEGGVDRFAGHRPRALVLVARPGIGKPVAHLLAALVPTSCPVPVVTADLAPAWTGPLDVVFAHCDDPGDVVLAESLRQAGRRGAGVLLTAPDDGPVAAATAGSSLLLPRRVPVPPGFGFARALTAGLVLLDTLGVLAADTNPLADELDSEAERNHPGQESFVSPAKSLALRLADRTPLLWGLDPVATAVAGCAAHAMAAHAGLVCDHAGYDDAGTRPGLARVAVQAGSDASIFADPDDPVTAPPLVRLLLLAVEVGDRQRAAMATATDRFPGADLLAPFEELGDAGTVAPICAAVLTLRFEMAAVYLGLATGMLGGSGFRAPAVR